MPKVLVQKLVHSVGLLLLVASFHAKVLADQSPPIQIGVSLPLSGPIAKMGVAVRNSILLADER